MLLAACGGNSRDDDGASPTSTPGTGSGTEEPTIDTATCTTDPTAALTGDVALLLDSNLVVEGEDCSISFLLVPDQGGVDELLSRLGLS